MVYKDYGYFLELVLYNYYINGFIQRVDKP